MFFLNYYLIYLFYKKNKMKNITSNELIDKLETDENAFLLDVRSEEEYEGDAEDDYGLELYDELVEQGKAHDICRGKVSKS